MKRKLTKADLSPDCKIPLSDYDPSQRGYISSERSKRGHDATGHRYVKTGDVDGRECPYCGVMLRSDRSKKGRKKGDHIQMVCPCGYSEDLQWYDF
jgi:hypothetical protein